MMNDLYSKAGVRIRKLRELNRYTREEFSEKADISSKFLYEIETGQKGFSADTLYRIAQAFSVNCDYIMSGRPQLKADEDLAELLNLFSKEQMEYLSKILKIIYLLMMQDE